ncbi:MAG TPA: hypothetical protein V6D25_30295 [Leptolyngbyaceae cyanobacterium]
MANLSILARINLILTIRNFVGIILTLNKLENIDANFPNIKIIIFNGKIISILALSVLGKHFYQ